MPINPEFEELFLEQKFILELVPSIKKKFKSIKELKIINGSAFELEKIGKVDFIFANHFLHHLPFDKISFIINHIAKYTKRVFLLNDIYRSNYAFLGLSIFCRVFLTYLWLYY